MSTRLLRAFITESLQMSPITTGANVILKNFAYAFPMGATPEQRRRGNATLVKRGQPGTVLRLNGDNAIVRFHNLVAPVHVRELQLDDFEP